MEIIPFVPLSFTGFLNTSAGLPFFSLEINLDCTRGVNIEIQTFSHEDVFLLLFFWGFFFSKWGKDSKVPFQTTSVSTVHSSLPSVEYRNPQISSEGNIWTNKGLVFVVALIACDLE